MEACARARQALCHYILSISVKLVRRPWAALHAFEGSELNMMRAQGVFFFISNLLVQLLAGFLWAVCGQPPVAGDIVSQTKRAGGAGS